MLAASLFLFLGGISLTGVSIISMGTGMNSTFRFATWIISISTLIIGSILLGYDILVIIQVI